MALEIKIPSPGESINEVELASWFVEDGALVSKNQEVGEIESEKATLPLIAEQSGKISIAVKEGETVTVGQVVASIDTSVKVPEKESTVQKETAVQKEVETETPTLQEPPTAPEKATPESTTPESFKATPVARQIMEKEGLSIEDVINGLRKINASDVKQVLQQKSGPAIASAPTGISREENRKKLSQLRKKISQRLVAVKNETAMLTTFNEADMSAVMKIRKNYQDKFVEKYGIKLGFMSFFTKAVTEALKLYPMVNSYLDGEEAVSPEYCDIGIAVQTDKGLMVPIIRNAEAMGFAELEKTIAELASKARKARLGIDEMTGGTFTISNGGIYGSMLSTPILNPPQSGILGMHNIVERPVAVDGKVEIRPMMYIALSYDHRVIDGKDSVGFLKAVKEFIENPSSMLFGAQSPEQYLLDI